ncbi:hypothetical protein AMTRI_Chr07g27620 [Amborella trichopoda]
MRRRRRLPPIPPPFLASRRPSHPALDRPSPSIPTPSRLHSYWSPATPFWNRIYELYPKPLCVPHKASPKGAQSLTPGYAQRVLSTTVFGPPVSFAQVIARSSPSLPLASSSVSNPPLGPFFVSIPFEDSSLLKAKF